MTQDKIMGLIRHILTFVGGILVMKGYISETLWLEVISGIMTITGLVWSVIDKIIAESKLEDLKNDNEVMKARIAEAK